MPPSPAMSETRQINPRRTWVCGASTGADTISSRLKKPVILLRHYAILKPWRQPATRSFHHGERKRLRHQQGRNRFPRLPDCIQANGKQLLRFRVFVGRNEHDFSAATIAFLGEFDRQAGHASERKDDGDVRTIHIQVRTMFEACTGVRRRAMAAHFANTESAHNGCAICGPSADYFNIGGSTAKCLDLAALHKDMIKGGGKNVCCLLGVILPGTTEYFGCEDDGDSGAVSVSFCRIAVFRACENRQPVLSHVPACAGRIIADQSERAVITGLHQFDQLGTLAGGGEKNR